MLQDAVYPVASKALMQGPRSDTAAELTGELRREEGRLGCRARCAGNWTRSLAMFDQTILEAALREKICAQGVTDGRGIRGDEGPGSSPALWLLDDLVGLLAEFHDRPMHELAPMIRRMLVEQHFVDDNGNNVLQARTGAEIDRHVRQITEVLESVRKQALEQGLLCDLPTCPLMYG
jgi:hypothetical protein